jgi:hypothetical protein
MTYLADDVQHSLPSTYRAEPGARFGIEVNVAALEQLSDPLANGHGSEWRPSWEAPVATATVPFAVATDELEILVYGDGPEGVRLVGAIELVICVPVRLGEMYDKAVRQLRLSPSRNPVSE